MHPNSTAILRALLSSWSEVNGRVIAHGCTLRVLGTVLLTGTCLRQEHWVSFAKRNVAFASYPLGAERAAATLLTPV